MSDHLEAEALHRLRYAVEALTKAFMNFSDRVLVRQRFIFGTDGVPRPMEPDVMAKVEAAEAERERSALEQIGQLGHNLSGPPVVNGKQFEGRRVRVHGHDYEFDGIVTSEFKKLNGKVRVVVEDDRGVSLIQAPHNLVWRDLYPNEDATTQGPKTGRGSR